MDDPTRLRVLLAQDPRKRFYVAADLGLHPATLAGYSTGRLPIPPGFLEKVAALVDAAAEPALRG